MQCRTNVLQGNRSIIGDSLIRFALIAECEDWGRRAEEKGTLCFRHLPRVSLPSWDEVYSYLTSQIRPRPSQEDVVLIQQEYQQLVANPNIGFDKLARLIDAMTMTA